MTGPLPNTWLSEKQIFKNLVVLQLRSNKLGYASFQTNSEKRRFPRTTSWCIRAPAASGSWCPTEDKPPVYMPKLSTLDIGNNYLKGEWCISWVS